MINGAQRADIAGPGWGFCAGPGGPGNSSAEATGEERVVQGSQLVIVIYLRVAGFLLHSVLIKTSQLALRMAGGWWGDFVSDLEGWQESVMMGANLHLPGQAW